LARKCGAHTTAAGNAKNPQANHFRPFEDAPLLCLSPSLSTGLWILIQADTQRIFLFFWFILSFDEAANNFKSMLENQILEK